MANRSIDLALDVINTVRQPHQWLSTRDIAEICGCSNTLIFLTEKRALRKVRERLRRELAMNYGEFSQINPHTL